MKKHVFTGFILCFALFLSSCSEEKIVSDLQQRQGLSYAVNEEKPFTGKLVQLWDDGKGQKKLEFNYKDGKLDGSVQTWWSNGQKKEELIYKENIPIKSFHLWNEDGLKAIEGEINLEGEITKAIYFYRNGRKQVEAIKEFVKNGYRGEMTVWYEDGTKNIYMGQSKDGQFVFKSWYSDGRVEFDIIGKIGALRANGGKEEISESAERIVADYIRRLPKPELILPKLTSEKMKMQ